LINIVPEENKNLLKQNEGKLSFFECDNIYL